MSPKRSSFLEGLNVATPPPSSSTFDLSQPLLLPFSDDDGVVASSDLSLWSNTVFSFDSDPAGENGAGALDRPHKLDERHLDSYLPMPAPAAERERALAEYLQLLGGDGKAAVDRQGGEDDENGSSLETQRESALRTYLFHENPFSLPPSQANGIQAEHPEAEHGRRAHTRSSTAAAPSPLALASELQMSPISPAAASPDPARSNAPRSASRRSSVASTGTSATAESSSRGTSDQTGSTRAPSRRGSSAQGAGKADRFAYEEDKRRRNTEASGKSGRFDPFLPSCPPVS
jgi:hypothetical protein